MLLRLAVFGLLLETVLAIGLELKLEPPSLLGASNDSATHYWFPTNMALVFNASHFLLGARLADDCSDYFCNHTTVCKPRDPSHQISFTKDGGRSFTPLWEVGGQSQWSPGLSSRPFLGPCTLELSDTARLSLYQGKIWFPWKGKAAIFKLDPISGLSWELAKREVSYEGAERVCEPDGHLWNQNVIKTSQGWLLGAQCEIKIKENQTKVEKTISLIFSSKDGYIWKLKSSVPADAPSGSAPCTSPGENTIVELTGGSLLLVSRCGPQLPLLSWVSNDDGVTWKRHTLPPNMHGVMPVAVRMNNGAIVLTTGRGGLALWLNAKGDGKGWTLTNLAGSHNRLVLQNRQLNGTSLQYTDSMVNYSHVSESTCYNTLRKLGDNDGVVCYDRKSTTSALPNKPDCSPPGNLDKNEHVFCMRFSVASATSKNSQIAI